MRSAAQLPPVLVRTGSLAVRAADPTPGSPNFRAHLADHVPLDEAPAQGLRAELAAERARQRHAWRDLPALRAEVRQAVELSSLRQVARAIGTSHEGLRRFLNGGKPYPVTLRKIVGWLESSRGAGPAAGRDAFELVTRGLSPAGKVQVREAMRRALLESGEPVPPWLVDEIGPDPKPVH